MKTLVTVLLLTSGLQQALAGCLGSSQYAGKVSVTTNGRQCQPWSAQSPQAHSVGTSNSAFPDGSVAAASNYCRDPDGTGYPWCYTTNPGIRWEGCRVDLCSDSRDVCASNPCPSGSTCAQYSNTEYVCFCNGYSGTRCPTGGCTVPNSYTGRVNVTVTGRACQAWTSQSPQGHSIGSTNSDFSGDGSITAARNYCRDPDNSGYPWCYTTDPSKRWEYCQINLCNDCTPLNKYKGTQSMTASGRKCQNWSAQYPQAHSVGTIDSAFPDGSVAAAGNYCRDPDGTGYLWCYTTDPATRWESCGINLCAPTCPTPGQYMGKVSVTTSGKQCQAWGSQSPQAHSVGTSNSVFPDGSVAAASNYCRDPDGTGYPWCYTTNPGIRWEKCDVDLCAPILDLCAGNPCPKGQVCAMNSPTTYLCFCAGYTGTSCPTTGCTTPVAYPGKVAKTMSGRTCQAWSSQSPQSHSIGSTNSDFPYDATVAGASNYCRDPDNSGFLWCYTTDPNQRWEACQADLCACTKPRDYKGTVSVTISGRTCQAWSAQYPQAHSAGTSPTSFPDGSVAAASNYCRDPDSTGYPWCYTTDPSVRWERCNVNLCGSDDPCVSSPCKNSGACKSSGTTFTCTCAVGYSGASCEQIVPDPCNASPCANGGVCARNGNNDFVCTCAGGFTGAKCESATGPCASSPCQNGGICSNVGTTDFNCDCPDDYNDGDVCAQYQNPCDTSPCRNNAKCTRLSYIAFTCTCNDGYVGQFCELKANTKPCDNTPCLNGGSCTNTGDLTYTCQCSKLWEGPACNVVHCLNDEKACPTLTYYGRFAKCDDCTKSVVCRAKKQRVKQCNAASVPYFDRTVKKCTTSNSVCAGL